MRGYQNIPTIKFDDEKNRWIVKSKDDKIKNSDIANVIKTPRRILEKYLQ